MCISMVVRIRSLTNRMANVNHQFNVDFEYFLKLTTLGTA
jgi:hypothetical protein